LDENTHRPERIRRRLRVRGGAHAGLPPRTGRPAGRPA